MPFQNLKSKLTKSLEPFLTSHLSFNELQAADQTLPPQPGTGRITEQEVYRYRKQRGVNLGAWFVQENWICDETFRYAESPRQSDLDIARGQNAKEVLETHWDTWIQEEDWRWLRERGFNSVRIPIGYYHLCGADPSVINGTDFHSYGNVFGGAWSRITRAIETAYRHGIGVLIDLHAAPGKQNPDGHSGTSNEPRFFSDRHLRRRTTQILCSLVVHLAKFANTHSPVLPNVVGIELLNEPRPSDDEELQKWYAATIKELGHIDGSNIPIYVGDCWRIDAYASFMSTLLGSRRVSGLVALDHHLYRCFTDSDIHMSANEHARALRDRMPDVFSRVAEKLGRVHGGLIVGEWSAALNPGSIRGEEDEVKNYVSAQLELYERHCAGWWFWTYKKQRRPDAGWCLLDAVEEGVFPPRVGMTATKWPCGDEARREHVKEAEGGQAYDGHVGYWTQYPGRYEHERFADGFSDGWDDGYQFFESGVHAGSVSEVGFVAARARGRAAGTHGGTYWEYEHGYAQGARAAQQDFLQVYCPGE